MLGTVMRWLAAPWRGRATDAIAGRPGERYRPEQHYMRGPGPKALQKQRRGAEPESAGR